METWMWVTLAIVVIVVLLIVFTKGKIITVLFDLVGDVLEAIF